MHSDDVVIVGSGHAGVQAAVSLREMGHDGRILIVGDEIDRPYHRPPLSKSFVTSRDATLDYLRGSDYFSDNNIDLALGVTAHSIDPATRRVHLDTGEALPFGHLILALGSRNRTIPIDGAGLDGVEELRTAHDARSVREKLADASDVVVIGGGFIGMEFAAAVSSMGKTVSIFECASRTLARSVTPRISAFLENALIADGVAVHLESSIDRLNGVGSIVEAAVTGDGRSVPADLVLLAVGAKPNTELAEKSGIDTGTGRFEGILVDDFMRTNHPAISAIGDCARFPSGSGTRRIESVQNAVDQARCVASRITGHPEPYRRVPWFWSNQGKIKLQIAGIGGDVDRSVVRGDSSGRFSIFGYRGDELVVVESMNKPGEHLAARRILEGRGRVSPEQAADLAFDLKTVGATVGPNT